MNSPRDENFSFVTPSEVLDICIPCLPKTVTACGASLHFCIRDTVHCAFYPSLFFGGLQSHMCLNLLYGSTIRRFPCVIFSHAFHSRCYRPHTFGVGCKQSGFYSQFIPFPFLHSYSISLSSERSISKGGKSPTVTALGRNNTP